MHTLTARVREVDGNAGRTLLLVFIIAARGAARHGRACCFPDRPGRPEAKPCLGKPLMKQQRGPLAPFAFTAEGALERHFAL